MKKMEDEKLERAAGGVEEGWTPANPSALASECPCFKEKVRYCAVYCRNCIYCVGRGDEYWCKKGQVL